MAYNAEIAIAVKGGEQLKKLQNDIKRTAEAVESANKDLRAVANTTVFNLNNLSATLSEAKNNFNTAARGTEPFKDALRDLIKSEQVYQKEIKERNRLLDEARSRQGPSIGGQRLTQTQQQNQDSFKAFFEDAAQQAKGISVSALNTRTSWHKFFNEAEQIAKDLSRSTEPLKAYNAELAAPTQRGAQTTMAGSYLRGQPKFGPEPAPGFDPIAGAARTRAAGLASEAIAEGREVQRLAQQKIELTNKVNKADRRAFIELNNHKIRGIQKRIDAEMDAIETKLSAAIKADNVEGARFDKELNRRIQLTTDAEEIYLKIREDSEKRIEARRKAGLTAAKKLEQDIAKQKADEKTRRNNAISSGLIGGAFPLLFGQGGGAAIGGGIGGFAGGMIGGQMGFALSLVGTQFGAFADQIVSGGATLGQALNPLTADIEALATAAGFAGTETGALLQAIETLGTQQQALEAATALLAATVGDEGVVALENFGAETTDLGNEFSKAMAQMQTAAAKFFAGIPGFLAESLKVQNELGVGLNLNTPEAKELQDRRNELTSFSVGREAREALGLGRNTLDEINEIADIDAKLITLAQQKTAEAERLTRATSEQLQTTKFLNEFGIKSAAITKTELALASQKKDLTNSDYVTLLKLRAAQELGLKNKKAEDAIDKNKSEFLKTNGSLQKIQNNNLIEFNNKIAQINRESEEAIDRKNKKIEQGSAKLSKQAEQLLQQKQQAEAVTEQLERQLAQSKVAGSVEAQKLGIEAKYEQTIERISKLKNQDFAVEQTILANQERKTNLANLEATEAKRQADAIRNAVAPIKNIRESQEANLAASKEYNRLLMEGVLPSEAKRIVEFNKQVDSLIRQKDEQIKIAELELLRLPANSGLNQLLQERLDLLKQEKKAIEGEASKGPGKSDTSDRKIIEDRVAELRGELTEMTKLGNVAVKVADNIGAAFSTAFQDVINGSKSTQQALSDMFKTIGENFVAMAADIIAQQIQMIILQTILKALGAVAGASGGGEAASKAGSQINVSPGPDALKGGTFFADPSQFAPPTLIAGKASGGPVNAGRPYMVGERGPEMFIPGSSGGIMRNEDMRQMMGRSPAGVGAPQMNFTFETTNIGGTEFVSREQLEVAMSTTRRQAASDGAKQGMSMTLDKMQNSPRTRSRVGIR